MGGERHNWYYHPIGSTSIAWRLALVNRSAADLQPSPRIGVALPPPPGTQRRLFRQEGLEEPESIQVTGTAAHTPILNARSSARNAIRFQVPVT